MDILIIGVEHELQDPNPSGFPRDVSSAEPIDKRHFADILKQSARDRRVSLIAEEQLSPRPSIPREVATALGISHEYVEMPHSDREAKRIPLTYADDPGLSPDEVQAFHHEREVYWVDRIEAIAAPNTSCILVCGHIHVDGAAALLNSRGHSTERIDVRDLPGFDLAWVKSRRNG
jgi:hypothetical protein